MKEIRYYIAIFLLVFITACSGTEEQCLGPDYYEQNKAKAADEKSESSDGSSSGTGSATELDEYLLEANIISRVVDKVKSKVIGTEGDWGAVQSMFDGMVKDDAYTAAIGAMFTLALTFYGIGVSTGIIQVTLGDAVIRVIKIAVIAFIASNWDLFYQYIASFFINGTDELIKYFLESFRTINELQGGQTSPGDDDLLFGDLDKFTSTIFSIHMSAIVGGLFSVFGVKTSPYALVYALVLIMSLMYLFNSIMKVVTIYCLSIFAKALLFALAPIFLSFMLFNQTKQLFDAWVKQLVNYSLQPVIVTAFLGMFVALIAPLLTEVLQLNVCWRDTNSSDGSYEWVFVDGKDGGKAVASGATSEVPVRLQTLLLLFFFSWLMGQYISLAEQISTGLTVSVAGNLSDAAAWMKTKAGGALVDLCQMVQRLKLLTEVV